MTLPEASVTEVLKDLSPTRTSTIASGDGLVLLVDDRDSRRKRLYIIRARGENSLTEYNERRGQ